MKRSEITTAADLAWSYYCTAIMAIENADENTDAMEMAIMWRTASAAAADVADRCVESANAAD